MAFVFQPKYFQGKNFVLLLIYRLMILCIIITSIYRQMLPNQKISLLVSSIVDMYMNKIALWISVETDDYTDKLTIIASNGCNEVEVVDFNTGYECAYLISGYSNLPHTICIRWVFPNIVHRRGSDES